MLRLNRIRWIKDTYESERLHLDQTVKAWKLLRQQQRVRLHVWLHQDAGLSGTEESENTLRLYMCVC